MKHELIPDNSSFLPVDLDSRLTEVGQGYQIGMRANGHRQKRDGTWEFDKEAVASIARRYNYQKVSFFGPSGGTRFYSDRQTDPSWFIGSFQQSKVANTIRLLYDTNPQLSNRVSYLLGGVVREQMMDPSNFHGTKGLDDKLDFIAQMTRLAEEKSTEAVTSVMARYILSEGSPKSDHKFDGEVYHMAEAVADDPIDIKHTRDLGLSQVARFRSFIGKLSGSEEYFPEIEGELSAFDGFPTVGAEFHFTPNAASEIPDLWRRLTILNLSQYHTESAIQLSRDDQGVIEVRMNPSIYPVTIANWNYMRLLLPELNRTSFTITLNRNNVQGDFFWGNKADEKMLQALHGLALLNYVRYFEEEPGDALPGEINFGSSYLGQTVSVEDSKFYYRGLWNGGRGKYGQFGVFAGVGDSLPDTAYYLSMVLHDPSSIDGQYGKDLRFLRRFYDAYGIGSHWRRNIFAAIDEHIAANPDLSHAKVNGNKIMAKLNP